MGVSERLLQVAGKLKFQALLLWVKLHQLIELALHLDDEVFSHDWGALSVDGGKKQGLGPFRRSYRGG